LIEIVQVLIEAVHSPPVIFSGIGFVYVLRFQITMFLDPGSDFMRSGIYQSVNVLVYVPGGALIAVGLILLVNSRLNSIQQNAKASLTESEEKFKQLADASSEAIVIHDMGKVVDCNELALKMSQYTREEATGIWTDNFGVVHLHVHGFKKAGFT
jgi:PAS domain-containing protein